MIITVFEQNSGAILRMMELPPDTIDLNIGDGEGWIVGDYKSDQFYIADGQPVAKEPKPGPLAEYDYVNTGWIEKPDEELAQAKAELMDHINIRSSEMRQPFITNVKDQSTIYQLKKEEASRYMNDPAPVLSDYPLLRAEIGVTADTAENVAQVYLQMNDMFMNALSMSESIRLGHVSLVEMSNDISQLASIKSSFDLACDGFMSVVALA